jgi:hypothetical protein
MIVGVCRLIANHLHLAFFESIPEVSSEHGEVTVNEAAAALAVSPSTIRRMISGDMLQAQHHCEGAPWIICLHDLNRTDVRTEAERRRSRRPLSRDPYQRSLDL